MNRQLQAALACFVLGAGFAATAAAQEPSPALALIGSQEQIPVEAGPLAADVAPAQALIQPQNAPKTQAIGDPNELPEKWNFYGGTVFLHRSAPASTRLITNAAGTTTILDAANMNFGWMFGFDVGGTYNINDHWGVDLRYFQVAPWTATFGPVTVPSSSVTFQGGTGIVFLPNAVSAQYRSALRSAELNARYVSNSWWTILAGFRYVNLEEDLAVQQNAAPLATFNWNSHTSNHLFGGQIGLEGFLFKLGRLSVDTYAKAGIYGTVADSFFTFSTVPPFPGTPVIVNGGQRQVSFLGDGGLHATWQLNRWASVEGGYQLMWLSGVALASDQFKASTTGFFGPLVTNSTGFVFYQGLTLALKIHH
jgi:hypothetical protein